MTFSSHWRLTNQSLVNPSVSRSSITRKGQSITIDFIVSISIFMLLIAIAYMAWDHQVQRAGDNIDQARAEDAAVRGLEALSQSPGYPSNWAALNMTPDNMSLLGLGAASAPGIIDDYKLLRLTQLFNNSVTYRNTTLKMGLSPFEADAKVTLLDGTVVANFSYSPINSSSVVLASAQRLAQWKNNTVLVRVRVWKVLPT